MLPKMKALFVDDEPRILSGLRRMLRPMRQEWEMLFAPSGRDALDLLAVEDCDVVISDMRMPGMDGVELLGRVRESHPHVGRMALSGQAAKETVLASVGLVHQYLAKPCEASVLRATLNRTAARVGLVNDASLRRRICGLSCVASAPGLYEDFVATARAEGATAEDLGTFIAQDIGMSARVMQLVSSAFFARPARTLLPSEAAVFLGTDVLKPLAGSEDGFRPAAAPSPVVSASALSAHSLAVARAARAVATSQGADKKAAGLAYTSGLLHDVGVLVLADELPSQYQQALDAVGDGTRGAAEAEREAVGATHAQVGALLLGLWGLDEGIVEAVAYHHEPSRSGGNAFGALTAVHVADTWVHQNALTDGPERGREVDARYLQAVGVLEELGAWSNLCRDAVREEPAHV